MLAEIPRDGEEGTTRPARVPLTDPIAQGPADPVLRGGKVFDLVTGAMLPGDVAICGDTIVSICAACEGRKVIDVTGMILVRGFIDAHLHVESSLITRV